MSDEFAERLFKAITGSVLPTGQPQENPFELVLAGVDPISNEIKAKALIIGRTLERTEWWKLSSAEADKFCQDKAESMGVTDPTAKQAIALIAMAYMIGQEVK